MRTDDAPRANLISVPADWQRGYDAVFNDRLRSILAERPERLDIDCSELDPVQSNHIAILWMVRQECVTAAVDFHLENVGENLVRALEVLDLSCFFGLEEREVAADTARINLNQVPQTTERSFTFVLTVDGVDNAVDDFLTFVTELGLPKESVFDLRTVFYEVATNIRCHSGLDEECEAAVVATASGDELALSFRDCGIRFDPRSRMDKLDTQAAAENRQTRGFGLSLIRRMVDSCSYEYSDSCNVFTLTKRFGDPRR